MSIEEFRTDFFRLANLIAAAMLPPESILRRWGSRLRGRHVSRALGNSAWLLLDRSATLLLHFLVGILMARYLGPDAFGSLNFAMAFIALLATIPYLGLAGTVVHELVNDRGSEAEIIGTVLWVKIAASVLAVILANVVAGFVVQEPRERLLILLISFSMLFDVGAAVRLFFDARADVRHVAMASVAAAVVTSLARVAAVIALAPLWLFAALVTAQSCLAAAGYVWAYRRHQPNSRLRFTWDRAKQLVQKGLPLLIAAFASTAYLKVDQIMLGEMSGMTTVGTYAVAARLSEVWYFIPTAIASSMFPRLLQLRQTDHDRYLRRLQESLRYLFWLSLLVAVPVSVFGVAIVVLLFGEPYREAGVILAIHVWACPAVFMGMAIEKWFIAEDLLRFLTVRQLLSAVLNIILNLILIPPLGGIGSAIATVISYTFAYYLSCFTSSKTVIAGKWMTQALVWPVLNIYRRVEA